MDRIYAAWQAENPSIAYTYMQYPNDPFTSDAEIMDMGSLSRYWKSSSISVRLLYNISNWCYGYSYGATPLQSPQDGQRQQQLLQQQPPVQRITQTPQQKQQQTNSVSRLSSLTSSPGNSNSNGQGTVVWNNDFWSLLGFKNHNRLVKRHYRYESSGRSFNDGIQIYNGDYYRLVEQQQQPQLQYPKYPPPPASYHGSPQNPVTPPSYDRNDWYNIRHATPLTDSMIQMHGYNQTLIRYYEFVARGFVDYINADPTHISTCAIINHTPGQLYRSRTA